MNIAFELATVRACLEEARSQLGENGGAGAAVTGPMLAAILKLTSVVEYLDRRTAGERLS